MKNIFFFLSFILLLTSCGSDDDICLNADSTPRLKLKFKSSVGNNALIGLPYLNVDVDYGNTKLTNIISSENVDSIFVPLRIDNSPYTDIYIKTVKGGDSSKIRINYDTKAIYVSPACGFKINYENLKPELTGTSPVKNIQTNNTSLTDEKSINFYLRF